MYTNKITSVFSALRDIVIVGDNDMVVLSMNKPACLYFGWTVGEVRGKSISFLLPNHPQDVPEHGIALWAKHKNSAEMPVIAQCMRDPQATLVAWTLLPVMLPPVFDFSISNTFQNALQPKLSIDDVDVKNKRIFIRVDYNVPIDKSGTVIDDTRIRATLPTLTKILADGGRVIIGAHLGRPKKPDPAKSLKPLVPKLEELLGRAVQFAPNALAAQEQAAKLKNGEVLLLENLRFYKGEDSKDIRERTQMAEILASYADLYVSEAFGTAHRDTASMTGIPRIMGAGIVGYLMQKEVTILSRVLRNPPQPVIAIVGGSKVSDKIALLGNLFNICQTVIIAGAMSFTFLEADGHSVGSSKVERVAKQRGKEIDLHAVARELIAKAKERNVRVILPIDHACAKGFKNETPTFTETTDIPEGLMALDVGPKTIELCRRAIAESRTCVWNGPPGVFEFSNFATGSTAFAKAIAENKDMLSIVGGGETAAAAKAFKDGITHISTGGGATLELLEGKALPGLVCLTGRAHAKL